MNDQPDKNEHDNDLDLTEFHAAFIVDHMIFDTAEHYGLCVGCLGKEIIRQLEERLVHMEHEPTDTVGITEGSA